MSGRFSRRELLVTTAAVGLGSMTAAARDTKGALRQGSARTGGAAMNTRKIPRSGEAIPVIGMGTSRTFEVGADAKVREPLKQVLAQFFAAGAKLIDTSPMYGTSEDVLGDLLAAQKLHAKAFLATKVWTTGKQQGIDQMKDSMRKLRTEKLDLMQVHNLQDWKTHLETLREWKKEGRIRSLGVTHYARSSFDELERILRTEQLDFVQLPYSIGFRDAEARLLPAARDTGTAVLVMRPFERGDLFAKTKGRPIPDFAKELGCESWGQYFLKFILGHPAVTCPIPATANPKHMADNLQAGFGRYPEDPALRKRMVAHLGL